jgi:drug/metabolite transporter (DMT)-like permease
VKRRKDKKKYFNPDMIIWLIRILLIGSILLNGVVVIMDVYADQQVEEGEVLEATTDQFELVFLALLALILTFLPDYIEKKQNIHFPQLLELFIVLFIFAGVYLSARYDMYNRFFWWDDLLHTLSGIVIGFIGFLIVYKLNHKYSMDINPLLIALFAFSFSVTIAVLWEVFEFFMDVSFGTAMQKWNLPEMSSLIGRPYQGSGLRDTMSDLILASLGALVTSVGSYFLYKNDKRKTLKMMREVFPKNES